MGRPPVVLGLDFGGTKVAVAVCDLQGNRLGSATVSTQTGLQTTGHQTTSCQAPGPHTADPHTAGPHTAGPQTAGRQAAAPQPADQAGPAQAVLRRSIHAARGLLATAAPGSEVAAVGASTFGIPYDDRVELAPAIDGWEDLALGRELREEFGGVPVRLATDAKAAAAAESRWGALQACDPAVYLNLGTGLSAALLAGGQVITGGNGAAGEIGYNLRTISDVGLTLGERTMLEDKVSGQALARRASGQPGRAGRLTAADAFAAGTADPALSQLIADFTEELAFHLVNLAILVNPVRIAAGGGLVRSWDQMAPRLTSALAAGTPFPPELVVARFPYDAPLLGAIALAVDAVGNQHGTDVADVSRIAEATTARQVTGATRKTMKNNTGAPA